MPKINLDRMTKSRGSEAAFRDLVQSVLLTGEVTRTIAVTSCNAGEGKTTVALELAASLADGGYRVAFVDADLRNSVIRERYAASGSLMGLVQFLSGGCDLASALAGTENANLFIIPAGSSADNAPELLGSRRFTALMALLRKSFDYVIVDTAPAGLVMDAAIAARACDGVILVIASGEVRAREADSALLGIERANPNILGVVLNRGEMDEKQHYGKNGQKGKNAHLDESN